MINAINILAAGSPEETLATLQNRIQGEESGTVEFIFLSESTSTPGENVITFTTHDDLVQLDPIVLKQVSPGLDADGAGDLLDQYIDQGLNPFGRMFQIFVPGGEITVLPLRQGPIPTAPSNISGFISTKATLFGLNPDGSPDPEDNGVGAPVLGSIRTANRNQKGAAIPIALAKKVFGKLKNVRGKSIAVTNTGNGRTATAPIVDLGPSPSQVAKGIALDLTFETHVTELRGNGLIHVTYRFI